MLFMPQWKGVELSVNYRIQLETKLNALHRCWTVYAGERPHWKYIYFEFTHALRQLERTHWSQEKSLISSRSPRILERFLWSNTLSLLFIRSPGLSCSCCRLWLFVTVFHPAETHPIPEKPKHVCTLDSNSFRYRREESKRVSKDLPTNPDSEA